MWLDYDENYSVSSEGEVYSKRYNRLLKPFRIGNYLGIWLGAGNKKYIHHLVAELFCPKINEDKLQIDHINRNTKDNNASNLRWVSASINMENRTDEAKPRKNNKLSEQYICKDSKDRYVVRVKGTYYGYYKTLEEAKKKRDEVYNAV